MKNILCKLNKVCFSYDGFIALRHIDLEILKGETLVLQGPNGCGKSTLLKILCGLIYPEEGSYEFDGRSIDEKSMKNAGFSKSFHQRVGFIFQNPEVQLFCGSVYEEIAFGPMQMGLDEKNIENRVNDLLKLLEIEHLKDRAPYHLSGGEKRKAAMASVLAMNPEVLILDEPMAGLDRKTQAWLKDFLADMKKAGKTIVISTHDDDLAELMADRIVEMEETRIVNIRERRFYEDRCS